MAHTQIPTQVHISAQGKHTSGSQDSSLPDNGRAVVHGGLDKENIFEKLRGHLCIQLGAAAQYLVQLDVPLKNNEGAGAGATHIATGLYRLRDGILQDFSVQLGFGKYIQHIEAAAANLLQNPPDLRLEQDEQGQNTDIHNMAQKIVESPQPAIGQPQCQQNHQNTFQKA